MDDGLINVYDFERAAESCLPRMAWDYFASGAQDEITLRANHAAYDRLTLRYHVLRDVRDRDLTTTVLGQPVSMPILIGPTAFHGLAHAEAEVATVRAAGAAGTVMVMSTMSKMLPFIRIDGA
jgi:4-hydroxymandelate oxidase